MKSPYFGLGLSRRARAGQFSRGVLPPAPFGWRYKKVFDRPAFVLLPLWVYWPVVAWEYRWWSLELLERFGFYQTSHGGYWRDGKFRFDFWNVFRERYTFLNLGSITGPDYAAPCWGRMERLGWWVERQIAKWNTTMPRWI